MVLRWIILFFSSRRRHTRLQGDWSSDVCSSDLAPRRSQTTGSARLARPGTGREPPRTTCRRRHAERPAAAPEERQAERTSVRKIGRAACREEVVAASETVMEEVEKYNKEEAINE